MGRILHLPRTLHRCQWWPWRNFVVHFLETGTMKELGKWSVDIANSCSPRDCLWVYHILLISYVGLPAVARKFGAWTWTKMTQLCNFRQFLPISTSMDSKLVGLRSYFSGIFLRSPTKMGGSLKPFRLWSILGLKVYWGPVSRVIYGVGHWGRHQWMFENRVPTGVSFHPIVYSVYSSCFPWNLPFWGILHSYVSWCLKKLKPRWSNKHGACYRSVPRLGVQNLSKFHHRKSGWWF